jgi:hypothetical protein
MFKMLDQKLQDARTLAALCTAAEEQARARGRAKPGSEHFVMAALDLPDGTALDAFQRLSLTKPRFLEALDTQRTRALDAVGVSVAPSMPFAPAEELLPPRDAIYEADASGKSLVQRLADLAAVRKGRGLLSADVLFAAAQEKHSATSRAFAALGISAAQLVTAASQAISQGPRSP